jgi:hypothetical protein
MGVEDPRMCSRHLVANQKITTNSKKTPASTVDGVITTRIKIIFEESNFELLYDMGAMWRGY